MLFRSCKCPSAFILQAKEVMPSRVNHIGASSPPIPPLAPTVGSISRFAECLVEKPDACPYAMPFGYSHLCGCPDRGAIIANTRRLLTKR